jgi:hypothetical protein
MEQRRIVMQSRMSAPASEHLSRYDPPRNPHLNRATVFTETERQAFGHEGLLPPAVLPLQLQIARRHDEIGVTIRLGVRHLGRICPQPSVETAFAHHGGGRHRSRRTRNAPELGQTPRKGRGSNRSLRRYRILCRQSRISMTEILIAARPDRVGQPCGNARRIRVCFH